MYNIRRDTEAPPEWDEFVRAHPQGTAYHLARAVQIGQVTFGLRTTYLSAWDDQGLAGILPAVRQSSVFFGTFLVSVPFFNYGGVLARDGQAEQALIRAAQELAKEQRATHLELRHQAPLEGIDYPCRLDKVSMVLELPPSVEALSKQLGSKLRSQIKRADREPTETQIGGAELVPAFYVVFCEAMHSLGTPVYPRKFFDAVIDALGERCKLVVIRRNGEPDAAAFLVRHGDSIEVPWAATTARAKPLSLNMKLYWTLLKHSVESGCKRFDFGRSSKDSGTYRFKEQWGAQPVQLYWHYWLASGDALPALNQSNPKYAAAAAVWRVLPRWLVDSIGPFLIRSLP